MKKGIIIILLLIGFVHVSWADKDRTPIAVNSVKSQFEGKETKYHNYKGTIYRYYRYYKPQDASSLIYFPAKYKTSIDIYRDGKLYTLYSDEAINYTSAKATFAYGGYLWQIDTESVISSVSNVPTHRFNLSTNKMEETKTQLPQNKPYSTSCIMDTSIYLFYTGTNSTILADVFVFNEDLKQLVYNKTLTVESKAGNNASVTSVESYMDADSVLKLVYIKTNGYDATANFYNPLTHKTTVFWSKSDIYKAVVAFGSVQGDKETHAIDAGSPTASNQNRVNVFFTKENTKKEKGKVYSKKHAIGFVQYVYNNETATRLDLNNEYRVILPSDDNYANSSTYPAIDVTYNYISVDKSFGIDGPDGHQKQIVLITADQKQRTNYSYFNSDIYMISPDAETPSTNFSDNTSPEYKDFWTLIGIADGAPPAPVDWELWDESHYSEFKPTSLELQFESSQGSTTSQSYETSHSSGKNNKGEITHYLGLKGSYATKDALINGSVNDFDTTITTILSKKILLNQETQNKGFYFYIAPTIQRFQYNSYCWWDEKAQYAVKPINDYMYMVTHTTLMVESRPLSTGIFQVSNPNDYNMKEWKDRSIVDTLGPMSLASHAFYNGLDPTVLLSWRDGHFEEEKVTSKTITTASTESTINSSVDWSKTTTKIPAILKQTNTETNEISFSTKLTTQSSLSQSIKCTMEVATPKDGLMSTAINTDVYLFTPGSVNWWYFDSLPNGFKPWYIAYTVISSKPAKITLNSPAANQQFYSNQSLDFNWDSEHGNMELCILSQPTVRPENIIKRVSVGNSLKQNIKDLEPGKYYWEVRGIDTKGNLVSSESRAIEILPLDFFKASQLNAAKSYQNNIPVLIYPNPTLNNSTQVSYELAQAGGVHLKLYTIQGLLVWEKLINNLTKGIYKEDIPLNNMGQIGIFVIDTPGGRGFQKILKQ